MDSTAIKRSNLCSLYYASSNIISLLLSNWVMTYNIVGENVLQSCNRRQRIVLKGVMHVLKNQLGQLFIRRSSSVSQNCVISHLQFTKGYYLNHCIIQCILEIIIEAFIILNNPLWNRTWARPISLTAAIVGLRWNNQPIVFDTFVYVHRSIGVASAPYFGSWEHNLVIVAVVEWWKRD